MSSQFGSWYRSRRRAAKVSLGFIADTLGVSVARVSQMERGYQPPPIEADLPLWLDAIGASAEAEAARLMLPKQNIDLATWVRDCRKAAGMTQELLAYRLDMTTVQLSKIENGHAETTLKTLRRMCAIFGVPFEITPSVGGGE